MNPREPLHWVLLGEADEREDWIDGARKDARDIDRNDLRTPFAFHAVKEDWGVLACVQDCVDAFAAYADAWMTKRRRRRTVRAGAAG